MCKFPARVLLQMRREVAAIADSTNDPEIQKIAMDFVTATNHLRHAHEKLHSCSCWYLTLFAEKDLEAFDGNDDVLKCAEALCALKK